LKGWVGEPLKIALRQISRSKPSSWPVIVWTHSEFGGSTKAFDERVCSLGVDRMEATALDVWSIDVANRGGRADTRD